MDRRLILLPLLLLAVPQSTLIAKTPLHREVKACLESLKTVEASQYYTRAKHCLSLATEYDLVEQTLLSGTYFFQSKFTVFAIETQFDIEKIASELKRYYWIKLGQFLNPGSVRYESTATLTEAYHAIWTYDWYTFSDISLRHSHSIASELKSRGESFKIRGLDLFFRYNSHRLFSEAQEVQTEFQLKDVPELPRFIHKDRDFAENLPAFYEINIQHKELHLKNLDLDHFTGLIVTLLTNCPESNAAANEMAQFPELFTLVKEHAIWLEDQVAIQFDEISKWNTRYPWAPMKSIYRREYWPIRTRPVPQFYFYKDGKVITTISEFEPTLMLENFKKIGVSP